MIRVYKHEGKLWRFEEGEQPAGAVLAEKSAVKADTPESRAAKAPARRKAAKEEK